MSSLVNIASTPSPISFSTSPPVVDGVDGGLRVIVEKRNDLAGRHVFADRGRAAQIREPQHRVDALGDAARDASAQHLLGSIPPEIDPSLVSARFPPARADLIASPSTGTSSRSADKALLTEPVRAPRQPVGIEAVHLPDGSGFAEPVHEGDEMPVTPRSEIVDHRKIERGDSIWAGPEAGPRACKAIL